MLEDHFSFFVFHSVQYSFDFLMQMKWNSVYKCLLMSKIWSVMFYNYEYTWFIAVLMNKDLFCITELAFLYFGKHEKHTLVLSIFLKFLLFVCICNMRVYYLQWGQTSLDIIFYDFKMKIDIIFKVWTELERLYWWKAVTVSCIFTWWALTFSKNTNK